MAEKKTRESYTNGYEWRREQLWKDIKEREEETYPLVISYFNLRKDGVEVSGKVFTPPAPDFKCECEIKDCFAKIKGKMHTKGGSLRVGMKDLKEYEITAWSSLLEYLRGEWKDGERGKVLLTGAEWWLLFGSDNKKKPNKKKQCLTSGVSNYKMGE